MHHETSYQLNKIDASTLLQDLPNPISPHLVVDVLKGIHCSSPAVDKQEFEAVSASFFKPL